MKEVLLDCRDFVSRSELHKAFSRALSFPEHYGSNLDALHDCLTAISEDTLLTLEHWSAAEDILGRYGQFLLHVLSDSAKENPKLHIHFQ